MNIIGQHVIHKTYGQGTIRGFKEDNIIIIFFEDKLDRLFPYPGIFLREYIKAVEPAVAEAIVNNKVDIIIDNPIKNTIIIGQNAPQKRKHNVKKPVKTNVAFKCTYCDGGKNKNSLGFYGICSNENIQRNLKNKRIWCNDSDCQYVLKDKNLRKVLSLDYENGGSVCYESAMLRDWIAYTGKAQTEENNGTPFKLKDATSSSLAILTTRRPDEGEIDRIIFAVFLIAEKFEGDEEDEGSVTAHEKYRMIIRNDELSGVKFWKYYKNNTSNEKGFIKWGTGLFRYWDNIQSAQLLMDICEAKKGKEDYELAKEFFNHYCKLKKFYLIL